MGPSVSHNFSKFEGGFWKQRFQNNTGSDLELVKDTYLPPMPGHEMAIIDNLEDNIASSQAEHLPDSFGR